jgi:lysophospholipase L1-like esterase
MKTKFLLPCTLLVAILFWSNAPRPAEKIVVYTIGDSTMANKDTVGNPERGWAMMLQPFFDENYVIVENHARNGRSSKSFFDEGRWQTVLDQLKPGDYVFIQFGHNDQKIDDPKRYTDPEILFREFLTMYVNETRAKGANPVLLTQVARRKFESGGERVPPVNTHGEYAEAVREVAKTLNVPLIDVDLKSRERLFREGTENSKRLYMWLEPGQAAKFPEGLKDDTHLNEYGAQQVAQMVVSGMREVNLPIIKHLK